MLLFLSKSFAKPLFREMFFKKFVPHGPAVQSWTPNGIDLDGLRYRVGHLAVQRWTSVCAKLLI